MSVCVCVFSLCELYILFAFYRADVRQECVFCECMFSIFLRVITHFWKGMTYFVCFCLISMQQQWREKKTYLYMRVEAILFEHQLTILPTVNS